jgi:protein involved in polysaccharide export with SLBB domain
MDGSDGEGNDLTRNPDLSDIVGRTEAQRIRQEELKNQIKRSAADINWEYAVIQRMDPGDLTTHLVPFNLGKAIEGEQEQNLELQPGDVITVFSQKDMQVPIAQQSRFVRLEGEFKAAGVYQVRPGETLRQLIARVGGFTSQAYLYGAEFTRESTRESQQQRLDQYNREMEQDVERSAGPRGSSAEETAAQRERVEGERRLLDKMRQIRASGRVVLETKPNSQSIADFPDLVLEDGDRLFVPFRPATVNVIGSVYNSNSFIFKPGETVSDYLKLSGGATRSGDAKKIFIIRASGETISRQNHSSLVGENFNHIRLMPGDTIVVPEKMDTGAGMRGIKDWSQVIGQFGIAAAAAGVLF